MGLETDVAVVGSGAAGLCSALAAADHGARVTVLECSAWVGGTTAVSGGGIWVPQNHHMAGLGIEDSREEALAYCRRMVDGRMPDELIETFVDNAPRVVRYLEDRTRLRLHAMSWPDYHPEMVGAKRAGRMLEPDVFDTAVLGEWATRVRVAPVLHLPITLEEQTVTWQLPYTPEKLDRGLVKARASSGQVTVGRALVASLLAGCLDRGVRVLTGARARRLLVDGSGRIGGVRYGSAGGPVDLPTAAVVLASGGFEWSEDLKRSFLFGPLSAPTSPPTNEGDGLRMAMQVGAGLANMTEAWWYPASSVPGDTYEDRPLSRFVGTERTAPHSLLVNRLGQRFVNESANYNDMMKALYHFDANGSYWRNIPCWSVMDSQYRRRYAIAAARPGGPDPEWLIRADTLHGLADRLGVDAARLAATVERFNGFARDGKDGDFGRGDSYYDRFQGDPRATHPNLGTVEEPPFYALEVHPGCVGTKGGPITNCRAEVLDVQGEVIDGLLAAGNVAASPAGGAYFGGGCSIAMALTWGYLAGITAATRLGAAATFDT
ncbi:MAG: FAD-dependent oxidoreductase [Actinomycetota bacterium]|nr:FAD-dependent oxidoreductase [Actinomycetota bacterium]